MQVSINKCHDDHLCFNQHVSSASKFYYCKLSSAPRSWTLSLTSSFIIITIVIITINIRPPVLQSSALPTKLILPWLNQKYYYIIVFEGKSQLGMRTLNRKQQWWLVCDFVACLHVLIFVVIDNNTINIPEIFLMFKVFWAWQKPTGFTSRIMFDFAMTPGSETTVVAC